HLDQNTVTGNFPREDVAEGAQKATRKLACRKACLEKRGRGLLGNVDCVVGRVDVVGKHCAGNVFLEELAQGVRLAFVGELVQVGALAASKDLNPLETEV